MKVLLVLCMIWSFAFSKDEKKVDTIDIPFKEATMLKGYTEVLDISIHAKTIDEDMEESFFDEDLLDDGVYAVLVRITNNSRLKVIMYSADTKLITDNGVRSTYPLDKIIQPYLSSMSTTSNILGVLGNITSFGMMYASGGNTLSTGATYGRMEGLRNDFYKKTLKETLMYPGDTITGFVFFKLNDAKDNVPIKGNTSIKIKMQFMDSLKKYDLITKVIEFK